MATKHNSEQFTFDILPPSPREMSRRDDTPSAKAAAVLILDKLSALQRKVLEAFRARGPMIDEQLVNLPEFAGYKDSTVWKRRSELVKKGKLVYCGEAKNVRGVYMSLWKIAE